MNHKITKKLIKFEEHIASLFNDAKIRAPVHLLWKRRPNDQDI